MAIGLIVWARFGTRNADGTSTRITVPSPAEGYPWLWDFLKSESGNIGGAFNYVQLPPWSLTQSGTLPTGDGYGVKELRNLDGTRYGNCESLLACIAALNANGCESIGDLVMHQMGGMYKKYLGADGKTWNGAGAQTEGWFRGETSPVLDAFGKLAGWNDPIPPYVVRDDVPVPADDFPFGKQYAYQNSNPPGIVEQSNTDYIRYVTELTGVKKYRYDDTKGTHVQTVRRMMDAIPGNWYYSEYFDGNPNNLNWWAMSPPMSGKSAVADFTLHWRIQAACNGFDATQFTRGGSGYFDMHPELAVGFVDNPDTDTSPGQQVIFNKGIAYAYMLMLPLKLSLVYGKDYFPSSVWPGAYGLKKLIDNLCWISRMFAFGKYQVRHVDRDVYVATRDGDGGTHGWSGGLLTGINFNGDYAHVVTVQTMWPEGTHLHDYTGHMNDLYVGRGGKLTVTIPANTDSKGQSYVCYAPAGVHKPTSITKNLTTQTFTGDPTLKIMPVMNGKNNLPQRIYCVANSKITFKLTIPDAPVGSTTDIYVTGPDGAQAMAVNNSYTVVTAGWYTITLFGVLLPQEGCNFKLKVTYLGGV